MRRRKRKRIDRILSEDFLTYSTEHAKKREAQGLKDNVMMFACKCGKRRAFCKKCKCREYKKIRCPVCHKPRYKPSYCESCKRGPHEQTIFKTRFLMYKEIKFPTLSDFPGEFWSLKDRIVHLVFDKSVLLKYHSDELPRFFIHCDLETDFDNRIDRLINLVSDCLNMPIHSGVKVYFLYMDVIKEYEDAKSQIIRG